MFGMSKKETPSLSVHEETKNFISFFVTNMTGYFGVEGAQNFIDSGLRLVSASPLGDTASVVLLCEKLPDYTGNFEHLFKPQY